MKLLTKESEHDLIAYLFITFLIYFSAHGSGVLNNYFNPDDWGNSGGLVWIGTEGRWLADIIFKNWFVYSLPNAFQFTISYLLNASIPVVLFYRYSGYKPSYIHYFTYAGLTLHPYYADVLNFDIIIFSFSFGLLLITLAGNVSLEKRRPLAEFVLSSLLVLLAASIYQLLALYYFVPVALYLALAKNSRLSDFYRALPAFFAGVVLYFITSKIYTTSVIEQTSDRLMFSFVGIKEAMLLLSDLPEMILNHTLVVQKIIPLWYNVMLMVVIALLLFLYVFLTILLIKQKKLVNLLHIVFSILLLNLPVYVFAILLEALSVHAPFRVMYLVHYSLFVSVAIAFNSLFQCLSIKSIFVEKWKAPSWAILSMVIISGVLVANIAWFEQRKVYEHDIAKASSIFQALVTLSLQDRFDISEGAIYISGYKNYISQVNIRLGSIGKSALADEYALKYLFKSQFDLDINYENEPDISCEAFPARGSVVILKNSVYICLTKLDGK